MKKKIYLVLLAYFLILTISKLYLSQNQLISGDGRYYYAQLRSSIIDGDWKFKNDLKVYNPHNIPINRESFAAKTDRLIIKYPIGSALMWSPAFITAHVITKTGQKMGFDLKADGYTWIYQLSLGFTSSLFLLFSIFFMIRIVRLIFPKSPAELLVVGTILCSSPLYYATMEPSMSHINSLLAVSAFTYFTLRKFGKQKNWSDIFAISISAALMILVRNNNVFFLVLSFYELYKIIQNKNHSYLKDYFYMGIIGLICLIPQFYYWKVIFGQFVQYSYTEESFSYLLQPKVFSVLFSRISGLITWHPILLIALIGLVWMSIKEKKESILFLLAFLIQLYLNASWECWWLGNSFGYRGLINTMPYLVLGLAFFYSRIKINKQLKWTTLLFFVLFTWNNILIFQFSAGWIEHQGPLYYNEVFSNILSRL